MGIRLGSGGAVTDTVTDALFEDIEVFNTQGTIMSANTAVAGGIKVYDRYNRFLSSTTVFFLLLPMFIWPHKG